MQSGKAALGKQEKMFDRAEGVSPSAFFLIEMNDRK